MDRARVNGHTGTDVGAVNLLGAHIGGNLVCDGAQLRNDSAPALLADALQLGRDMFLRERFTATGAGEGAVVDLTDAQAGGKFVFAPARLEHKPDPHQRLAVDGLTYAGVPDTGRAEGWLELLRDGIPCYAAVLSAAGRRIPGARRRPAGPPHLEGATRRPARPR